MAFATNIKYNSQVTRSVDDSVIFFSVNYCLLEVIRKNEKYNF